MPSEGFPFIVGGSGGWTLVRLEWLVASSSHRRRVGVASSSGRRGVVNSVSRGKLQNLSFSKVSKQVVMLFFVAGVALCDIPTCLLTCRKCQNWRMSHTKCSFCCTHVFVVQSSIVNFYQIECFSSKNSFPHNFVWPPASSSPHTPPTISPPIFVTPTISPPIFVTPSVSTIIFHIHISTIFVNHHLCQPSVPTTNHHLFVNHLCQPPSFTYIFQPSLSTTIFHMHICQPSLSTIFVNHHLSHTYFNHLCQPPSLSTICANHQPPSFCQPSLSTSIFHIHVNHHLSHTSLSNHLCQPSLSTIFVNHHLSHTYLSNHLCQPSLSTTIFHIHISQTICGGALRGRRGTRRHSPSFCVAGVALMALGGALGPD